eukprot:TRINITY_DN532_c0_g1_i1.p1 TRINITY_DN532_c0_g1~~TRINITY_DN532_c0_g1_i1.p1  ORF type:complete len:427 (+),score=111.88 TRINITY_DN532_c0_g1_i1:121-1281(+)
MPGDGIGKVCLDSAIRVIEAAGLKARWHNGDIGWEFWRHEGNPLPDRTVAALQKYKLGFFGAITSKPNKLAQAELDEPLRNKGLIYYSPIVTLRQKFNLDVSLRPCKAYAGNPLNFIRRTATGAVCEPAVDAAIFRQNTECLYCGVEWTNPPDNVYNALASHPRFKNFANAARKDLAVSCRIFTRPACRRICQAAFEYAAKYGKKSVTLCEKPNVIRETSGMMYEEALKVQKTFPSIPLYETNIDAQMMWLTKNPEDYSVIISSNMFGDIASDAFAGLVGGLGFAPSGNIGKDCAVFEPTHGSAPKYAEYPISIVNPIATILTGAMLLDHIGMVSTANKVRTATAKVIKEGKVRTYDMLMLRGSQKVLSQGAASTEQMANAIIDAL